MFYFLCASSLLQLAWAGSYAPPPPVQPSPLIYGSQLPPGSYNSPYGAASLGGGGLALPQPPQPLPLIPPSPPAPVLPLPPSPAPILPVNPPQTYNYPIQAGQTYDTAAPVYNDQFDTTTLPPPTPRPTTPYVPPVAEQIDESEKYGVPEIPSSFNANPRSPIVQPVPTVAAPLVSPAPGGYAPPPGVQPAPNVYGAPPVASSSSYGGSPTYNELEYTAGEVPAAVVQPGNQAAPLPFAPGPADVALNNFFPTRAIRAQKKTALKAKAKKL